jgi:superfamily I DNA/RNA helicase
MAFHTVDTFAANVTARVSISTMHLAKRLEFRTVAVMACDRQLHYHLFILEKVRNGLSRAVGRELVAMGLQSLTL